MAESRIKLSVLLFAVAFSTLSSLTIGYYYGQYKKECPVSISNTVNTDSQLVGPSKKYLGNKNLLLPPGFDKTIEGNEAIKQLYLAYLDPKTNTIVLEDTEMSLLLNKFVYSQNHL